MGDIREITGPPRLTWMYACVLSLVGLTCALFISSVAGPIIPLTVQFRLSSLLQGAIISSPLLTAAVATMAIVPMADRWGRKPSLLISLILLLLGSLLSGVAPKWPLLLAARLLGGLGCGAVLGARLYGTEVCGNNCDKKVFGLQSIFSSLGTFVGLAFFLLDNRVVHNWRMVLLLPIIPSIAAFIAVLVCVPESPRWLISKGRLEEAQTSLDLVYGKKDSTLFHLTSDQYREPETIESWMDLRKKKYRKPLMSAWLIVGLFELPAFFYSAQFLVLTQPLFGVTVNRWSDVIVSLAIGFPHAICAVIIIASAIPAKMRKMFYIGELTYGVLLLLSAALFLFIDKHKVLPYITVASLSFCSIAFSLVYPLPPALAWHTLPPEVRGRGAAFASSSALFVSCALYFCLPLILSLPSHFRNISRKLVFVALYAVSGAVALLCAAAMRSPYTTTASEDDEMDVVEQLNAVHRLPVVRAGNHKREEIKDEQIVGMKEVMLPEPPPTPEGLFR